MAYDQWLGGGGGGAIIVGDDWDRPVIDQVRLNLKAMAARRAVYPLGGSRHQSITHSAVIEAYDYLDIELDGTEFQTVNAANKMYVRARIEARVEDAGITVTPEIYNVTTATVMVTGSATSGIATDYSGTQQKQTLEFTPTNGVNKYRLRFTPSAATFGFWGLGYLEVYA